MPKKDGKPRGRMSSYAFFVQTCREEHKKKHPGETVVFAEFTKKCAEAWKQMSDREKKRFEEMADKDRKRYETEMSTYDPPKGAEGGKKRKKTKDPRAPKRALSAFFFFSAEEREKVRKTNPNWTVSEVAKELGFRWGKCTDKSKYEVMARADKLRYEKEMSSYKSGGGGVGAGGGAGKKTGGASPQKKAKKVVVEEEEEDEEEEEEEEEEEDDDEDDD